MKPTVELPGVTLYLADCLTLMPQMGDGSADVVITDPPYDERTHAHARYGFRETSSEIDFMPLDSFEFVTDLLRISRGWVLAFCALEMYGAYAQAANSHWVRAGFWRKRNGVPQFTGDRPGQPGEGIAIMHAGGVKVWNGKGRHAYWDYPLETGARHLHRTQKPLALMVRLVLDFTQPGDLVLDPYMGSGTTAIACIQTGRRFKGIEIKSEYFQVAVKRIQDALAHQPLPLEGT